MSTELAIAVSYMLGALAADHAVQPVVSRVSIELTDPSRDLNSAKTEKHRWAGRTLNDLEWRIHEELAMIQFYGVFDTVRFELEGTTVRLSGQVVRQSVKASAERVVGRLDGVDEVVNEIELLPSSRRDDVMRMGVYRAIYESRLLEVYGTRAMPSIHIIVKNGAVALEGVVDSETDRNTALSLAVKVTPHVANNLRVAPEEE